MFRRRPAEVVDPLLTAPLADRVATAHTRMAHQHDPALVAALSERELAQEREVAEAVRDHARQEELARVSSAQSVSAEIRRAQEAIVRVEAADLVVARKALAEQRRQASAHSQVAALYRQKMWASRALAGVVLGAMLYSAVNVQQNLAPGGAGDPLFWASYLLEALISTVLVVFMINSAAVARWGITQDETLIRWIEGVLLAMSIGLNTYPYLKSGDLFNVAVHSVAPVMVGVALFAHTAVMRRYGLAIDRASTAADEAGDDIAERLTALADTGHRATTTPEPAPAPAPAPVPAVADDEVIAQYEAELNADPTPEASIEPPRATADPAPLARDEPLAREEAAESIDRAPRESAESIARGVDRASRASDDNARATADPAPIAREEAIAREPETIDRAPLARAEQVPDRASRVAQTGPDLETDRESRADHSAGEAGADARSDAEEPVVSARAIDTVARETQDVARDRRAVVSLARDRNPVVSIARDGVDRAQGSRAGRARSGAIQGALARAIDSAPRARTGAGHGPFDRALSRAEADTIARAVVDRKLSRKTVEELTAIYEAVSAGTSPNAIGTLLGLPHSTVGRALDAATKISGPRLV